MVNRVNLIDMNFKNLPVDKKREAFVLMDMALKVIHSKNYMVTDFSPNNIYLENGFYYFDKVSPISARFSENKEEAVLRNVLGLSNLAFCSYLPDYRLEQGQLNFDVISNHFDSFAGCLPSEDLNYYKSILVDGYRDKKLPGVVYYSDHIVKQNKNGTNKGNGSSLAYIKATEAGRAFANQDEAAFGHKFFFVTMAFSVSILLIGLLSYFYVYLG